MGSSFQRQACVKVEWVEIEEELSVICVKVMKREEIRVLRGVVT